MTRKDWSRRYYIDGCSAPWDDCDGGRHHGYGMCNRHYVRAKRAGILDQIIETLTTTQGKTMETMQTKPGRGLKPRPFEIVQKGDAWEVRVREGAHMWTLTSNGDGTTLAPIEKIEFLAIR